MILLGNSVASEVEKKISRAINSLPHHRKPTLAVILVGAYAPSHTYVNAKKRACARVGILPELHVLPESTTEKELLSLITSLNLHPHVDGILLQLPLPNHLSSQKIIDAIDPSKDVDGIHSLNMGKLLAGIPGGFVPCTPLGIQKLLTYYQIPIKGQHVVIVGRSRIVGKPLAALLLQNNATVTVTHSHTKNLSALTQMADILIAALGVPLFVKEEMVKAGSVVIDVGMNRIPDSTSAAGYRLVGDVDFENVQKKCSAISPVPKGIGPMTVALLLHNTLLSFIQKEGVFSDFSL